jgi:uncharacterized repeat protein (TIGR03803 family)
MKSRIITGTGIVLFAALWIVTGLRAQEQAPAPGQLASGAIFETLFNFENTDGADPSAALVQGTDGNLYGTTVAGLPDNYGTVFKITPQGKLTTLHSFDSTDGSDPETALVLGTDGNFYGTTFSGGANPDACSYGCGTVFRITPAGALTTLHRFCVQAGCADGDRPGALVQGTDGNFYGTTAEGGSTSCVNTCGTVFKITPTGVLTTLYSFTAEGGYGPSVLAGLVQGTDGNFYGTTGAGGSGIACSGGCGTVFKITSEGVLTTLHNFTGTGAEGWGPVAMIQAVDGNFYGTTLLGGPSSSCGFYGCGTVFKIAPQGTFTTLTGLNFNDGSEPWGRLVQGTAGNFYATGESGGGNPCNCGAVFEVTPEGVLTRLHGFNNSTGGYLPFAGLLQATNGTFYGDTFYSNPGYGLTFSLSVGLGPFVKSVPAAGKIGTAVKILGNNLDLATNVTFNGTAASFTVESPTYIKATVPAGATTGPVEVTLPSGRLSSNVNFQVLP